ncbi:MAG: TRAP transporter substrate-binding protein [Firmicutes bacterium]|nr:TRAP transporter substrate-binding protein [Bacillota bacterium]MBQ9604549.1 TRAP transporter substrate-binding protein [Bacillota bacterium]
MKKYTAMITAFLIALIVILTGCINAASHQSAETEEEPEQTVEELPLQFPLMLKVGYSTNTDDPRGVAFADMKEEVEKKTNGNIILEIHPNGELGSDSELIAGLISGNVDMTVSSAGNYAQYATRIGVSSLPFLFADFDSAWRFIDSEKIQAINGDLEEYNIHVLAYFDNGFRCVTTSEAAGAVTTTDDMIGLNIRTPENQIVMETMSELGANPKGFPFANLKAALSDGTFDAQENPIPVIYNNKLYEVQKYLSVTNHSYDAMPLTIRSDIWNKLPEDYKTVINEAAKKAETENRQLVKKQTEDYVALLEQAGMQVTYPDLEAFRKKTTGVKNVFSGLYGKELLDYLDEFE